MNEMIEQLKEQFTVFGPSLLAGLAVLVLGWLVALLGSFVVRKLLSRTTLDNRLAAWMSGPDTRTAIPIEAWAGKAVLYLIMLVVLIAFFATIRLDVIAEPLNALVQPFIAYLPNLIGAGVLVLIAWVLATVVKKVIAGVLQASKLDDKLGGATREGEKPVALSRAFAEAVYWLIFLIFLPLILQALELQSLLEPVTAMFNKVAAFLPNIISAAAIAVIGWFIARIVQRLVQSLLAGVGVDRLSEKWGMAASLGKQKLSGVLGLVVYSRIIAHAINASDSPHAPRLALVARVVILALAGAMALRQTGLANDIVNLAFGLTLGAAAVAFALAFGLGGRDIAARTLEDVRDSTMKEPPES